MYNKHGLDFSRKRKKSSPSEKEKFIIFKPQATVTPDIPTQSVFFFNYKKTFAFEINHFKLLSGYKKKLASCFC